MTTTAPADTSLAITLRIVSIVVFSFLLFLAIGLPLAILPAGSRTAQRMPARAA